MLENFLTKSPEEFRKLLRLTPMEEEEIDPRREAYRYAKVSKHIP
jgi:hypothetical protein